MAVKCSRCGKEFPHSIPSELDYVCLECKKDPEARAYFRGLRRSKEEEKSHDRSRIVPLFGALALVCGGIGFALALDAGAKSDNLIVAGSIVGGFLFLGLVLCTLAFKLAANALSQNYTPVWKCAVFGVVLLGMRIVAEFAIYTTEVDEFPEGVYHTERVLRGSEFVLGTILVCFLVLAAFVKGMLRVSVWRSVTISALGVVFAIALSVGLAFTMRVAFEAAGYTFFRF